MDDKERNRDSNVPQEVEQPPAHGDRSAQGSAPSLLDRIGEISGARPAVSLREVDSAHQTPMLKPLGSDAARTAGKYLVHGILGQGGVGTVYRGHDTDLGRDVAMKFLHERYQDQPTVLHRFVEEAQIGGQLQHPGIVPVYEFGMAEGRPFFTMKMVKGQTLAKRLSVRASPASDRHTFLSIFEDVCQTMAYAHARGVVHRDLKPANIMIGSFGEVQIVDWGMGKVLQSGGVADEKRAAELQPQLSVIETVRSAGHGTQSVMGSVMGTPAYMPPEQAHGDIDQMDERSDVFALGAILCEILTGQPPYVGEPDELIGMAAMAQLDEARARLDACDAEADLIELATKCLMPAPAARPQSAEKVAKAVQAHLATAEQRVHDATIRTLAMKRTQKFGVALTLVIAAGLAVSLWFWNGARDSAVSEKKARRLAEQSASAAKTAGTLARAAQRTAETNLANFNRLSHVVRLETAKAKEKALYPAWPHMAEALREWLNKDVRELRHALPGLRSTLASLQARAIPWSDAERAAAPSGHPRARELAGLRLKLSAMEQALAMRSGSVRHQPVVLDQAKIPQTASEANSLAWPLVDPERSVFGQEAEALAMAREAYRLAPDDAQRASLADTLAWAWFANGLDDEALKWSRQALALAADDRRIEFEGYLNKIRQAVSAMSGEGGRIARDRVATMVGELELAVHERLDWQFEDHADQFLHATLDELVRSIEAFAARQVRRVERRLAWANRVTELTITPYRDRWEAARLAILRANGKTASELYAGTLIELKPQVGLVPIGMNPKSKLWEFYHLRSGWDADRGKDPAELPIPQYDTNGKLDVAGRGIVFVLVPGGKFLMGAQKADVNTPNYDPLAWTNEGPVTEVELAPFFLSKYELSRGQWKRLTGESNPNLSEEGSKPNDTTGFVGEEYPVEQVSHDACDQVLTHHGLLLPTEAQWERACRGDTTTPWSTGSRRATLEGFANLLDRTGTNQPPKWPKGEAFDDHAKATAPIGTYRPNRFGLHDLHGNVVEWCRDWHGSYNATPRAGDGLREPGPEPSNHVYRGGCYLSGAHDARCSARYRDAPASRFVILGVRPARRITP